jgi:enoyl-CoA hydratase/carnithine racemase
LSIPLVLSRGWDGLGEFHRRSCGRDRNRLFNRPEKLNPISGKLMTEMIAVAHELQEDEASRVVILTGKGRSFGAGADIGGLTANAGAQAQRGGQSDAARLRPARTGLWRSGSGWIR